MALSCKAHEPLAGGVDIRGCVRPMVRRVVQGRRGGLVEDLRDVFCDVARRMRNTSAGTILFLGGKGLLEAFYGASRSAWKLIARDIRTGRHLPIRVLRAAM